MRFLETENAHLLAYAKGTGAQTVVCVVNLDPRTRQVGLVHLPVETGMTERFAVTDLLSSAIYDWRVGGNYVALDPGAAHVMAIRQ